MLKSHCNAIKPVLTEANKYISLKFTMSFVRPDMQFSSLNYFHIDEKWFYLTKKLRFLTQVMNFTAVARSRHIDVTASWWDGKIGTWPFVETVLTQRTSSNRGDPCDDDYGDVAINGQIHIDLTQQCEGSHCGVGHNAVLELAEYRSRGWSFELAPQTPNSPDPNIHDLGLFAALQLLQYQKYARSIDK
ncbi:hypothetical protein H310_08833 [Aphanomyces invadans]|uniref:Uncharacterized protein n=1 Tax=Aphanomyces invadans TaxID=157072 RepID=A0A024TYR0_9STRA|nr:hypothetical protein H310_08833 [Aphanomyces invadans]ETV98766.1 hypothetical protein H310_08833 [Aphanomyces invadans]|eukprot:XP_008872963.1 hypothetical protein H310_08833 [Aphanomyces invadans]